MLSLTHQHLFNTSLESIRSDALDQYDERVSIGCKTITKLPMKFMHMLRKSRN